MTARGTKRVLVALGVVAGLVAGLGFAYRDTIQTMLVLQRLAPDHEFVDAPPPARPDYENPGHWAALPDREDLADRGGPHPLDSSAAKLRWIPGPCF